MVTWRIYGHICLIRDEPDVEARVGIKILSSW